MFVKNYHEKNINLTFCINSFFNCVNKAPSVNEEDYKKEQKEYEVLKEKLTIDKSEFFKENKEAIMKKTSLFKKLKDTATKFSEVNTDSTFFLKDVTLNAINYRIGRSKEADKIVFLPKRQENISRYYQFKEAYEQLYSCEENANESCENMKVGVLKEFLDIKYAFVIDGYTIVEPSIDKKDSFMSGLYYGSVLVYDIINDKPLYRYAYTGTNSEQISYRDSGNSFMKQNPIDVIKNDFEKNVSSALRKETKKYFNFN